MAEEVGRVVALWRYPVKSMAGEPLAEVEVSWNGLAGDRRWAFVLEERAGRGFPWFTLRERADLGNYQPRCLDPERPDRSAIVVRTPSGAERALTDPALMAELAPGLKLLKQDRGAFDTMPLSLLTTASVASLGRQLDPGRLGAPSLDVRRFRPNLVVQALGDEPFPEDGWVGDELQIGGATFRVDKRDQRCVVINIDPTTAALDARILKAVGRERQACLGVYGSTVRPGRIAVGDPVLRGRL